MKIYNSDNSLLLDITVDDNSYRHREIMGENTLTLYFATATHTEIPVGAYTDFEGERYTLMRPEALKMQHTRNFEYTVMMEGSYARAKLWKFRNTADGRLKFSLTARPHEHLEMFVANMNRRDSGWTVGTCIDGTEKCVSYDHAYCWDALCQMADTFGTEFEITGKTVSLHKVEYNRDNALTLSYGRGNGFKPGIGRSNYNDTPPIEILYPQGGTQNIDPSEYGSQELHLPKSGAIRYDGQHFEDESGFNAAEARQYASDGGGLSVYRADKTLTSMAEESLDCSEIYPKRVGKVSQVICEDYENHFYDFTDTTIPDNLNYENYLIEGETMTVIFQSGMLAGKEFEVKYVHEAKTVRGTEKQARRFEIVPQEIDGVTMPNDTFKPAAGNEYAVFHCYLPTAYINDPATKTGAEWDMMRQCVKYLYDHEEQNFSFTGTLDGLWAKQDWVNVGGRIILGGYVLFTDDRFQREGVKIRIIGIKDYINNPHSPELELSNSTVTGSFTTTLAQIQSTDVQIEESKGAAVQFTKRRWRDAKETMEMLEAAMLEGFTNSVSPITVQTMQMLVGAENLQFRFTKNTTDPITVDSDFRIVWDNTQKQLKVIGGIVAFAQTGSTFLQHMTLGISDLSASHKAEEYRFWRLQSYTSAHLYTTGSTKYYLYARCERDGDTGTFRLEETAHAMEDGSYYWFLVGVLNSEYDDDRSFASLYGFTEILPGRITTDRVVSSDGNSFFDLVANAMKLGDALSYMKDEKSGLYVLKLKGVIVADNGGNEELVGVYRGVYDPTYYYYKGDTVVFTDPTNKVTSLYRCLKECTGIDPTNIEYWQVQAQGSRPNTSFKSTVFLRSLSKPSKPTGGSYASPVPSGWSDGVPAVTSSNKEWPLWASTRLFSSDGLDPQQAEWTDPQQMADTVDFDVEFSSYDSPSAPSGHPNTNPQWSNAADDKTIWMATSNMKNGSWSNWEISKIKGERGDDGKSISIKGSYATYEDLIAAHPTGSDGECYMVGTDLYVWDGSAGDDGAGAWINVGKIKGENGAPGSPGAPGDSAYLHIKYAESLSPFKFTDSNGEVPGRYIGIYCDFTSTDSTDPNDYTWTQWKGEDGHGYEYIYRRTQERTQPATPYSDPDTDDYRPDDWTDNPVGVSETWPFEWVSFRKKTEGTWGDFSAPALWANFAFDGTSIRIKGSYDTYEKLIAEHPTGENGDCYVVAGELYVWDGEKWQNVGQFKGDPGAQGDSAYLHIKFANSLTVDDWTWTDGVQDGETPGPYIGFYVDNESRDDRTWSLYKWCRFQGEDGMSQEYVYLRTESGTAPVMKSYDTTSETFQADEFLPQTTADEYFTDDPQGVSQAYPYEWVSQRKKTGGKWGAFSAPALWAKWGQDGISPNTAFKSTVFKRSATKPSKPTNDASTGGSYASPVPSGWSDGVPDGTDILWASTRIFSSDGASPQQSEWTEPKQMTDTADFDVEFSSIAEPAKPSGHPNTNPQWSNAADDTTIWMATSTCKNGVWSEWQMSKIKGEDGRDGTSINIKKGDYKTVEELTAAHPYAKSDAHPDGNVEGDCYIINGYLYVWDGDSWENVGQFKGDPGANAYLHIKYANSSTVDDWTANNGETPGAYIGVYCDNNVSDSMNWSDYTWTKWKGEDGYGYEYVYLRTTENSMPVMKSYDINSATFQANDFIPQTTAGEYFTDDPQGVSKTQPYEWVSHRMKAEGKWGAFSTPALWAKWGQDGEPGTDAPFYQYRYRVTGAWSQVPDINSKSIAPANWSLIMPEVGIGEYLWVSVARFSGDGTTLLDEWSTPQRHTPVDGTNGKGGQFTSTVFKRTNTQPDAPTGGSYTSPVPTDTTWTDGIPEGTRKLWASSRIFTADGESPQQDGWSTPAQMTDTASFQVKYSTSTTKPADPDTSPSLWADTATTDTMWMATRTCSNGEWAAWQIMQVKGEKGSTGDSPAMVYRGLYDSSKTYYGTKYRIDCVQYGTNTWYVARTDAGTFSGIDPTNLDKWNPFGANFESIATSLLLAQNANIAGWIFRDGRLESQSGNCYLDGVNGIAKLNGYFDGDITAKSTTNGKETEVRISATDGREGMTVSYDGVQKTEFLGRDKSSSELFTEATTTTQLSGANQQIEVSDVSWELVSDTGQSRTVYGSMQNGTDDDVDILKNVSASNKTFTVPSPSLVTFGNNSDSEVLRFTAAMPVNNDASYSQIYFSMLLYADPQGGEAGSGYLIAALSGSINISQAYDLYEASVKQKSLVMSAGTYVLHCLCSLEMEMSYSDAIYAPQITLTEQVLTMKTFIDPSAYQSSFFGNGFAFGTSGSQHFQAIVENGIFATEAISGNAGFRVKNGTLQLRIGGVWYTCSRDSSTGYLKLTT